jgi:hypothetical protein
MPASLGQKTMAASFPVTLASNQSPLDVSLVTSPLDVQQVSALAWHVINDSGTMTSLTQMNGQAIAMGTGLRSAGTQRVTIATDDLVPVSGSVTVASTTLTATVAPTGLASSVSGRQVVATAGTAAQFTSQACKVVAITAETDNTGYIVVGDSAVVAALATRKGLPLAAGDTAIFAVSNMNVLYMDTTVNGDGVTWVVLA